MALAADRSVRLATAADARAMGAVQRDAWLMTYHDVLPADVLAGLDVAALSDSWRTAIITPPSRRHRVLVALADGAVVGFAAAGPSPDPDVDPDTDAEIAVLLVSPEHLRAGHGSRLLQALVDTLRPLDFRYGYLWLGPAEDPLRTLVESAGWSADGALRELDLAGDGAVVVSQERLHTRLDQTPDHEHADP